MYTKCKTKLSIACAGQYVNTCEASGAKSVTVKNNLPDWMGMPILTFVCTENSECDCFFFAPFLVLHYCLGVISVECTCLYTEMYSWAGSVM